ncbi:MAG: transposase [Gemmatimonadaceae bacterium]|jgi:putative transposase|nr:transposase [Gemmatimonadaceae bacterium]
MRTSRFTPEQILAALRQAEGGTSVADVTRKLGITETFVYRWKTQYAGLDVGELRERKSLREENAKLRQVVADLVLDTTILKDALGKTW